MDNEAEHSMDGELRYGQPGLKLAEPTLQPGASPAAATLRAGAAPALFSYAATPNPVPYTTDSKNPSVVTLMIAVANTSGKNQPCSEIVFKLPTEGSGALTKHPDTITPSPAGDTRWSIVADQSGTLTATPRTSAPFRAGDSIAFILEGVQIADTPGASAIAVSERTDALRQGWCLVAKTSPGLAITRLTATPIQILAGEPTTLTWTTTGATGCTLAGEGRSVPVPTDGSLAVHPKQQETYSLTASGKGPPAIQQITVVVPEVKIVGFRAAPREVYLGGKSTLSWDVLNARECSIEPGNISVEASHGSYEVAPERSTQYTLQAYGYGIDTKSAPTWVNVRPARITRFTASTATIPPLNARPVTLEWATEFASRCTIEPDVGVVPGNGTRVLTPRLGATYTLRAAGLDPTSATAAVSVRPALTSFSLEASTYGRYLSGLTHFKLAWTSRTDGLKLRLPNETVDQPATWSGFGWRSYCPAPTSACCWSSSSWATTRPRRTATSFASCGSPANMTMG